MITTRATSKQTAKRSSFTPISATSLRKILRDMDLLTCRFGRFAACLPLADAHPFQRWQGLGQSPKVLTLKRRRNREGGTSWLWFPLS